MIVNPYNYDGIWLKGNLHTHTENSPCGHYSLEQVINMYSSFKMKYDFLAITDHYNLTNIDKYRENTDLVVFSGVEFKKTSFQTLGINISKYDDDNLNSTNHQDIFIDVENNGGINIICHPHVSNDDYWPLQMLLNLSNYTGIEIYNNNVKFDNKGRAVATDLWDSLLSSGKRIWGFANDDMHIFQRCGGAFNMVLASEKNPNSIMEAIKRGSFYGSTGIFLDSIKVENSIIAIDLTHKHIPATFNFIGYNGELLQTTTGSSAAYNCKGTEGYVRVEMKREDGAMAWTQPFLIEK